jgi:hypothetical protein
MLNAEQISSQSRHIGAATGLLIRLKRFVESNDVREVAPRIRLVQRTERLL